MVLRAILAKNWGGVEVTRDTSVTPPTCLRVKGGEGWKITNKKHIRNFIVAVDPKILP